MSTQSQVEREILAKAEEDGAFRAQLLENPKAAIKAATGLPVPDGINVYVLEDNATDCHLVLPPASRKLLDQEISSVAGGIGDIDEW